MSRAVSAKDNKVTVRIENAVAKGRRAGRGRAQQKAGKAKMSSAVTPLDQPARDWAQLLRDPCYAPIAHPVYPGADGGLLARFESEFTFDTAATATGCIVGFVPGGLSNSVYVNNSAAITSDTTTSTLGVNPAACPGLAFLQGASSAVRCVSACMQVAWPGSEFDRQGFVALGQVSGSVITEATTVATSVSALRPLCHLRTRVPESFAEVIWRPALGDAEWTDPNITTGIPDLNKKGGLLCAFANGKAATGIRIRFVVTYEWQPKQSQGLGSAYDSRSRSRNSMDDVQNFLDKNGPDFAFRVGRATTTLAGMTGAYMAGRRGNGRYIAG